MAIPGLEVTYPLTDKGPGNPNIPPGGSADARAIRAERLRQAGSAAPTPAVAPTPPGIGQRVVGGLRTAGQVATTGGAVLAGGAAAKSLRDFGSDPAAQGVAIDQRQAGDSASSMQIPTGGPAAPPAQGYNFWTDNEAGRNIGNVASAVAPLGGVAMAARVPGALSRGVGLADAALTGLASGVRGEREAPTPAPSTPSLRVRPEDAFAGPPALAAGMTPPAAVATPAVGNVTRVGNEYSGTNVRGDISVNGRPPGGGAISAQNMAAADALASRNGGTADVSGGQGGMALPQAPTVRHSGNDWNARNTLRNAEVSASSITNTRRWGGKGAENSPDVQAYKAMLDNDLALQRTEPGVQLETLRSNNGLRGQKLAADASRYGSDNSLRGTMYSADSQLGAKRMEMERSLRQQQLMGGIYQAAGGDPAKAAKLAASYGLDGKSFQDMAAADQTRTMKNAEDARDTFKDLFLTPDGKIDKNAEANAHVMAAKIVPGWENMSAEQRAANRTKVVDAVKLVQGMNATKDTGWLQKIGLDSPNGAYSQLPELVSKDGKRAQVGEVGWWEGMTTPNVSRGDTVITLPNGTKRYLRGQLEESQAALLEQNGAQRQR